MSERVTSTSGTAVPGKSDVTQPVLCLDGQCYVKTLKKITNMSSESLKAVTDQSEQLMAKVLQTYAEEIAPGEVGADGSALASAHVPDGWGPTGLLYGRIQSGKTVAMITFTALAIDNGFRVIVVLTTNFLELVQQTRQRFNDLARVLVRASTEPEEWSNEHEREHLKRTVRERGLVIVCAKHAGHLSNVRDLIREIGGDNYPALILDDEADQASLDNNERKRSSSSSPEAVQATAVHQAISDIRGQLRHHIFLQVTATPYALLLQRVDSPLRPRFTFLLNPGQGYTGGEDFFSETHIKKGTLEGIPPLRYVSENESEDIESSPTVAPRGLESAIAYFLVAASAQALEAPHVLQTGQNFLCHTSQKRSEHDKLRTLIVQLVSRLSDELEPLSARVRSLVAEAYRELMKTKPNAAPLEDILDDIVDRLPHRKIRLVNSDGKSGEEAKGAPNFIIGGNIIGRGLTIPNLLVTYYLRKPKISQMDTMLQHARMFGYRAHLMPYTRVFLPRTLAVRFWSIHEAENELRTLLPSLDALEQVPVRVVGDLRPTRYGVLDTGSIVTIPSGKHLYPLLPTLALPKNRETKVVQLAKSIWPGWSESVRQERLLVPVDLVCEMIDALAPNDWDEAALRAILRIVATNGGRSADGKINACYRTMDRGQKRLPGRIDLPTGILSGPELQEDKSRSQPTFYLFRQRTPRPCWESRLFYYPTLVFPKSMPSHIYNSSEP